jgi:hypothetical protein
MACVALNERRGAALGLALATMFAMIPARPAHADSAALLDSLATMDFARDTLEVSALRALDPEQLPLLRGAVFGRHGRVFETRTIQFWLRSQTWYRPDTAFRNDRLNDTERANLDLIRQREAETHEFIQPGDLRWWQDRRMSSNELGPHSTAEWIVLRAEVEAVHGRGFPDQPWLQHYFDERYWYRPDPHYDPGALSSIERQNLVEIESEARAHGIGGIEPCDMGVFTDRPVTVDLLRGASFSTLRILRNEVYARHGMMFGPPFLSLWFADQDWYVGRDIVAVALSPMEQRNVATIVAYERALRDSLHTVPLDTTLLIGMFAEDARRLRLEMVARHGRVFRRKWEQDYVASLPGYRPDPGDTDARLTAIERANIAAIVAYEKTATSVMDAVEG